MPFEKEASLNLQRELKISDILCNILVQRGIGTFELSRKYFRPDLSEIHDPFLMKDMDKAVARILDAINRKEKILVFGDYDVDGTTAVASMYRFLNKKHTQLEFYIPHRYKEGYGISKAGIDYAKEHNFSLIISVDCGIKSYDLIQYAKEIGIEFIVCDHHLPDEKLPPAVAILNPKQKDCDYPYKELCGCGVGYKLISALAMQLGLTEEQVNADLDLLATAIAADIVPMTGENRILAFHGLKKANENPNLGIRALCNLSGLKNELHINNLVFMIAPRVNAAGRMDEASKAVQMFIADNYDEAIEYAELLHNDNSERKEVDENITGEALMILADDKSVDQKKSTVVYKPHWHKGVVGIVASRLIEHYYRPTIVLTKSGGFAAGSARSVPGFNLYEAVHACREYLLGYGGHFAAAGLTLEIDKIEAFRKKFEDVVSTTINPECLVPEIIIDSEIEFSEINWTFYNILKQMEPFGPDNLRPVFIAKNVMNTGYSKIVKEKHIRFSVKQNNVVFTGIGFNLSDKFSILQSNNPIDIVFKIDENEWNGARNLQLRVIDFRSTNEN